MVLVKQTICFKTLSALLGETKTQIFPHTNDLKPVLTRQSLSMSVSQYECANTVKMIHSRFACCPH